MANNNWDESKHPRDDEGKFTFKGQGTTNPNDGNAVWERRANIFYSNMDDKKKLESALPLKSSFKPDESEIIKKHNTTFSNETLKKARTFIQSAEKFEENAYKDEKGIWTIGYGHTYGVKPGDKITKEQAEKLYAEDFKIHSEPLKYVKVPLNNNEKIALASLIYNIGEPQFKTSTVLKMLNEGNKKGAADAFELFCKETKIKKQNGQIVKTKEYSQGLHNRRLEEKKLFLTPDK